MIADDEKAWVRRALAGDGHAWEQIVQAHQQPVFRLAYLLLGDADDAEDVAQETFLRAYHALARFDAERSLRPWLLRIATNLAYNWRRSASRYLTALQRLLWSEPPPPSARQQAEQHLEAGTLWEAVRSLPPADQQVIYLRYFLEVSESEAAEALNIPAGTVKSRLHRALAKLRAKLPEPPRQGLTEGSDG